MNPLVSIIVPCYNQAQYLPEALDSVLKQTYQDWECIIVNDGSPDNTKEVAGEWLKKDERFKYIEQENRGLSGARNAGIEFAKGEYILPLDADDKISEDYLELAMKEFQVPEPPRVVSCQTKLFGEKTGECILKPFSMRTLAVENILFCSSFFRRSDWKTVGGYDENMKFGLEDWEFWISLLKNGGNVKRIDKVCFYYRIKNTSMLKEISGREIEFSRNYIFKKHNEFYLNNFGSFIGCLKEINELKEINRSKKNAINVLSMAFLNLNLFKPTKTRD